ncbi:MAG TPA: transaldolase [Candidatus Saccharimonadales bacterium]|nr:transaldolase [Candidatus Saccharimonadales bacterium]
MNPTATLRAAGQSLWLDNITRELLTSGTLVRYIAELSVTGLTSNPTIYDKAIEGTSAYDAQIRRGLSGGLAGEDLFFELALDDLRQAADDFRPVYARTRGVDGWVSLEVSPLLVDDAEATVREAIRLHGMADRPNLFVKIPGTPAGLRAIEDAIFAGVPVNATLLFSAEHYLAAGEAYLRGIERRVDVGLDPVVASVASVFVSRWDSAVAGRVPERLESKLGIAMGKRTYAAYRRLLATNRWQRLENEGARPQRLLWASTGTKDPKASDVLYVAGLAAPHTVNTMPDATLQAFADHGSVGALLAPDGGDAEETLAAIRSTGIDIEALGQHLQADGTAAFVGSWTQLMECLATKMTTVMDAR